MRFQSNIVSRGMKNWEGAELWHNRLTWGERVWVRLVFKPARGSLHPSPVCSAALLSTGMGQIARFPASRDPGRVGTGQADPASRWPVLREMCGSVFSCTEETCHGQLYWFLPSRMWYPICSFVTGKQDFNDCKQFLEEQVTYVLFP